VSGRHNVQLQKKIVQMGWMLQEHKETYVPVGSTMAVYLIDVSIACNVTDYFSWLFILAASKLFYDL